MKSHVDLAHRETVVATYPDGTRVEFKRLGGVFRCVKCPFEVRTTLALQVRLFRGRVPLFLTYILNVVTHKTELSGI